MFRDDQGWIGNAICQKIGPEVLQMHCGQRATRERVAVCIANPVHDGGNLRVRPLEQVGWQRFVGSEPIWEMLFLLRVEQGREMRNLKRIRDEKFIVAVNVMHIK